MSDILGMATPDARLIRRAFTVAYDRVRSGRVTPRDHAAEICSYVKDHGTDRRYSLFFNAASTSFRSAIVTYRGARYYVDHDYPTNTFRVTSANR